MDENSCENETSESADGQKAKETENVPPLENVGIRLNIGLRQTGNEVQDRVSSFDDDSGPSRVFSPVCDDNLENTDPVFENTDPVLENTEPVLEDVQDGESSKGVEETKHELTESAESITGSAESIKESTREQTISGASLAGSTQQSAETSERIEYPEVPTLAEVSGTETPPTALPQYEEREEFEPRVRMAPSVVEQLATRRPSVGPPPSYSFVMKQKKKQKPVQQPVDPLVISTPPPPSYTGSRGMFIAPEERICNFPSFADPIWRSHSQPALCPRCGIIVLTTTHTHDSIATHVAALALCLFGCWPCCLIPYCMNVCKNTYHHCPICQTFLGLYKPW